MLTKYLNLAALNSEASKIIFNDLFWNILRRPISFFDTTSSGMILNRCTDDIAKLDIQIPKIFCSLSGIIFQIIATMTLTSISYPLILAFFVPNLVVSYIFIKMYLLSATELKRLNKLSLSPILTSVSELIKGSNSIRLYGYRDRILRKWEVSHNTYMKICVHEVGARSWFQLVLNLTFAIGLGCLLVFMIFSKLNK